MVRNHIGSKIQPSRGVDALWMGLRIDSPFLILLDRGAFRLAVLFSDSAFLILFWIVVHSSLSVMAAMDGDLKSLLDTQGVPDDIKAYLITIKCTTLNLFTNWAKTAA